MAALLMCTVAPCFNCLHLRQPNNQSPADGPVVVGLQLHWKSFVQE